MNLYWYCFLSKIIGITGFVTLVIYDHPWMGVLCFLVIAAVDSDDVKAEREIQRKRFS